MTGRLMDHPPGPHPPGRACSVPTLPPRIVSTMNDNRIPAGISRRAFVRRATVAATASACGLLDPSMARAAANGPPLRVRVWCEGGAPRSVYPRDIDGALGDFLKNQSGVEVKKARLD